MAPFVHPLCRKHRGAHSSTQLEHYTVTDSRGRECHAHVTYHDERFRPLHHPLEGCKVGIVGVDKQKTCAWCSRNTSGDAMITLDPAVHVGRTTATPPRVVCNPNLSWKAKQSKAKQGTAKQSKANLKHTYVQVAVATRRDFVWGWFTWTSDEGNLKAEQSKAKQSEAAVQVSNLGTLDFRGSISWSLDTTSCMRIRDMVSAALKDFRAARVWGWGEG